MNTDNKIIRLIVVSPWSLLIFLVIPVLVILSVKFHLQLPVTNPTGLLTVNNVCFAVLVAIRLLWSLSKSMKSLRYSSACGRPRNAVTLRMPLGQAQRTLQGAGYTLSPDGTYGEKRDFGYLGTTLFYTGLLVLLTIGIWDNLQQFSGTLLDGMGPATKLSKIASYSRVNKGMYPARLDSLPQVIITRQIFPDSNLPKGATEVALLSEDGTEQKKILVPGVPLRSGNFDIAMTKLVFEPQLVIKTTNGAVLFDELVKLDPLVQKRGVYSFYGIFQGYGIGGGIYYQPETSSLMVVVSKGDKKVVSDLVFQVDQQVTTGEYTISCTKMGQWTEIRVVHRRHKELMVFGAIAALFGLLLRILIRPQRVWLEETGQGCMVWSSRKGPINVLNAA